jgi:hypothetical protein
MKFYETHFEEYAKAVDTQTLHPELAPLYEQFPKNLGQFGNLIVYGPSGVGKYSQVLHILKRYSPSELKYEKRITMQHEKLEYSYPISDIHYEIDMSFLGCNSKIIWHEVFSQIVDIVSMKSIKIGIIVCKNFHKIHNELLEIFYSYMQQFSHPQLSIQIRFVLITEHIGFIPNSIIQNCRILSVKRPLVQDYQKLSKTSLVGEDRMADIAPKDLMNLKEYHCLEWINPNQPPPPELFNVICDAIIQEMLHPEKIVITDFRDIIYDILVYNVDVYECIWHVIEYFIQEDRLDAEDIRAILDKTHSFFKYYNNNYRPIYHIENMLFFIINKVHGYDQRVKQNIRKSGIESGGGL